MAHNGYWHRAWGERPTKPAAAVKLARRHLSDPQWLTRATVPFWRDFLE